MNLFTKLFKPAYPQVEAIEVNKRLAQGPKPFLLDVRQPDEYRAGHIAGARLIPLGELGGRVKELPHDREIICVCRSGNRSGAAASQLASGGYRVANLQGGMIAWAQAGLPVKRGSA